MRLSRIPTYSRLRDLENLKLFFSLYLPAGYCMGFQFKKISEGTVFSMGFISSPLLMLGSLPRCLHNGGYVSTFWHASDATPGNVAVG